MDKENIICIYRMEYYSVIKNEIMSFTRKWMELEIIKMPTITCFNSYAEYRPKMMIIIIIIIMAHKYKRGSVWQGNQ
jgi:branched-subunit amino acid transport protein AzlD